MTEHVLTGNESPDRPYKSQCSCGAWFYLWSNHMECVESGCECWHIDKLKALDHLRATASDPRISRISDDDFDLATGRPLTTPEDTQ